MNALARGTEKYYGVQLTLTFTVSHRELVPRYAIAPGNVGSFLTVFSHITDGEGGLLGAGNPVPLEKVMYLAQPTRAGDTIWEQSRDTAVGPKCHCRCPCARRHQH